MPDRLADQHDSANRPPRGGPFGWGSPARYHVPAAPVVAGSALSALATARRRRDGQRAIGVAVASSLSATALTGYIIRTVNLRLFDDGPPIAADERQRLITRWHALNRVRLALLAIATLGFEHAAWSRRSPR
ncbi:anthrone oxygenase family protein [Pseudonocardia xinjiangensis]|uniref:anthrone oxygenase family protein n=1 Tax=Pseudonocardia xinjiangensis TaxID=75289 RepID=UPI003D8ED40A